jgi:hypothetical protein
MYTATLVLLWLSIAWAVAVCLKHAIYNAEVRLLSLITAAWFVVVGTVITVYTNGGWY